MTTQELIAKYLEQAAANIKEDAASKGQKIPVSSFEVRATETEGQLTGAYYFKYLVHGRPPGKQPPPEAMLKFVESNPGMLLDAQKVFGKISAKSLAYLIGRKIGREGTDIHKGVKPGIDLQGAIEGPLDDFLAQIAYHKALNLANKIVEVAAA